MRRPDPCLDKNRESIISNGLVKRCRLIAFGIVATFALQVAFPALHVLTHECGHGDVRAPAATAKHSCACRHHAAPRPIERPRGESGPSVAALDLHEDCAICAALRSQLPPSFTGQPDIAVSGVRVQTRPATPASFVCASAKDHCYAARAPPIAA